MGDLWAQLVEPHPPQTPPPRSVLIEGASHSTAQRGFFGAVPPPVLLEAVVPGRGDYRSGWHPSHEMHSAGVRGLGTSAPHCPAMGTHLSTPRTKAASPEAPECPGMVVGGCRAPLSSCSGEGPAPTLLVGPLSQFTVWGINGGWQQLPTVVWVCVCPYRGGDGQDGHSGASGRAMTWDISNRRMWMQAQLGAASERQAAAAVVNPALSLLGWRFNYHKEPEESACRGLRANAARSRVGGDGRAAPYTLQGWSSWE